MSGTVTQRTPFKMSDYDWALIQPAVMRRAQAEIDVGTIQAALAQAEAAQPPNLRGMVEAQIDLARAKIALDEANLALTQGIKTMFKIPNA